MANFFGLSCSRCHVNTSEENDIKGLLKNAYTSAWSVLISAKNFFFDWKWHKRIAKKVDAS